jgi:predicted nucleic acid-binding protein
MWPPSLVVDSGALIALARLDLVALLARYFDAVIVTASVWDEVMRGASAVEATALRDASDSKVFTLVDDPDLEAVSKFGAGLGIGERTSITYAQINTAALLLDDRRAKAIAQQAGVLTFGPVALLVQARKDRFIPELTSPLRALTTSGYYLAPALIEWAKAEVGEE